MSTPKYKKFYELMSSQNEPLFDKFQPIHDGFVADQSTWEEQFHHLGRDVVDVVRDWERRLCSGMERGNNAIYSDKLADKFWGEVKKRFSHIEMVGLKAKS